MKVKILIALLPSSSRRFSLSFSLKWLPQVFFFNFQRNYPPDSLKGLVWSGLAAPPAVLPVLANFMSFVPGIIWAFLFRIPADCTALPSRAYPHYSNCSKYIECSDGGRQVKCCPAGKYFNPGNERCDLKENVRCENKEGMSFTLHEKSSAYYIVLFYFGKSTIHPFPHTAACAVQTLSFTTFSLGIVAKYRDVFKLLERVIWRRLV